MRFGEEIQTLSASLLAAAQEDVRERGISFEFQDHGAAHSIYLEDPDGLRLELTTYDV